MQLVFTPDLGSTTILAAAPNTIVSFATRVSAHDYNEAVANGTHPEVWGNLPLPDVPAGQWSATRFEPAPIAPEHHDAGVPPKVLSLLPQDPKPVPTSSAAPESILLVASFVIPADTDSADYEFTYRLAHSNESGTWHTWLGDSGSNGHLILKPDAPPIEGLVFSAPWDTRDNDIARESAPDGTVASLTGPVEWSGWALDLDPASDSPATPRRFSTLPAELSATHLALFPAPGLTALNPAAHTPVLFSTTSRLSLSDRGIIAHGGPIRLTPLSRSALEASLPEHTVLLPESAASAPFVALHDTRGSTLAFLPTGAAAPGTQVLSLDLDKVTATAPAKTVLYSSALGTAALYTPESRLAVGPLGADVQVCGVYALEEWQAGLIDGLKVAPEPELVEEEDEIGSDQETEVELETAPIPVPVVEPTKVAPPPIQTTQTAAPQAEAEPVSPETPVPETATTLSHPASRSTPSITPNADKKSILELLRGVAYVVMFYVTRSAWSMFGWGFKMFGVGVHAANSNSATPATNTPTPKVQEERAEESESESENESVSLNEVTPTPIDPAHRSNVPVVVVGDSNAVRKDVHMPLTPPMSPKTAAPTAIPGPESTSALAPAPEPVVVSASKTKTKKTKAVPAPKPKLAFAAPTKSTLLVLSDSHDANPAEKLNVSVGGEKVAASWDVVSLESGKAWVIEVFGEQGKVEVGCV